jgi:sarcosine oxidase delta subunit
LRDQATAKTSTLGRSKCPFCGLRWSFMTLELTHKGTAQQFSSRQTDLNQSDVNHWPHPTV